MEARSDQLRITLITQFVIAFLDTHFGKIKDDQTLGVWYTCHRADKGVLFYRPSLDEQKIHLFLMKLKGLNNIESLLA
jgi:hypothetical protein